MGYKEPQAGVSPFLLEVESPRGCPQLHLIFISPYSKSEIIDPINTSIFQMTAMAVTVGTQIRESIHTLFFVRDLGVLVANHIFVLYLILFPLGAGIWNCLLPIPP